MGGLCVLISWPSSTDWSLQIHLCICISSVENHQLVVAILVHLHHYATVTTLPCAMSVITMCQHNILFNFFCSSKFYGHPCISQIFHTLPMTPTNPMSLWSDYLQNYFAFDLISCIPEGCWWQDNNPPSFQQNFSRMASLFIFLLLPNSFIKC